MYLTMHVSFVHEDHSGSPTPVFCICNSFLLLLELLFTQNKIFCYDIPYALIYHTLAIFRPLLSYPAPKHSFPLLPSSPSTIMHYCYYFLQLLLLYVHSYKYVNIGRWVNLMLHVCFRDDHLVLDNQINVSSLGKTNFSLSHQSIIAYGSSSRGRALEDFIHLWCRGPASRKIPLARVRM